MRLAESTRGFIACRTFRTKAGDSMSDFEIITILLTVIGLLMTAYRLGKK